MNKGWLHIIVRVVFLIIGNILIIKFGFSGGYLAALGVIILMFSIFGLSSKVPGVITGIFPTISELKSGGSNNKLFKKHTKYSAILLISLSVLQGVFLYQYFENQKILLLEIGMRTKAIIYHKEWTQTGKSHKKEYKISYYYEVNNKLYNHTKEIDNFNMGDTIEIIYLPENPYNHEIIESSE